MKAEDKEQFNNEAVEFVKHFLEDFEKREAHKCQTVDQLKVSKFQELAIRAKIFEKAYLNEFGWKVHVEITPPDNVSTSGFVTIIRQDEVDAEINFLQNDFGADILKMIALSDDVNIHAEIIDEHDGIEVSLMFVVKEMLI